MNQYTQAQKIRHAAPEGAQPVDWERLAEEYFGEAQTLRALLSSCRAAMRESTKFHGERGTDWSHMIAAINALIPE